jgi:anti-sigma B factor antagonist
MVPTSIFMAPPGRGAEAPISQAKMRAFDLIESDIWPGWGEIRVEGELDLAVAERFEAALERALASHEQILVDLSACEFLDASALVILRRAQRRLRERGSQLLLRGASGQVRRILSITGLSENGRVLTDSGKRPAASKPRIFAPVRARGTASVRERSGQGHFSSSPSAA